MTSFESGDVILVPFPFTDQQSNKKRPAVVVSSPAYHRTRSDIIIMALTSNLSGDHTPLSGWSEAGLPKPTAFKPLLATLETDLVLKRLGHLNAKDIDLLAGILGEILI
jgi:mRNA interferase MazF